MKKLFLYGGGLVGLLLVLLVVTPFFIPKSLYLNAISNLVKKNYPATLTIHDASLRLLPRPTITLKSVAFTMNGESQPLFETVTLRLSSHWLPLLKKVIVIDFGLSDSMIRMTQSSEESYNFSPLLSNSPKEEKGGGLGGWQIAPSRVALKNISIEYQPFQAPKQIYQSIDLTAQGFEMSGERLLIKQLDLKMIEMAATFSIDADLSGDESHFVLSATLHDSALSTMAKLLPPETLPAESSGTVSAKATASGTSNNLAGSLDLSITKLNLTIPESVAIRDEHLTLSSHYQHSDRNTSLSKGVLQLGDQRISFAATLAASGATQADITIDPIQFDYLKKILIPLATLPAIEGAAVTTHYASSGEKQASPRISGHLSAKKIDLTEMPLTDVALQFDYKAPSVRISSLKANAMDGSIAGSTTLELTTVPTYTFNFDLRHIALDQIDQLKGLVNGHADFSFNGSGESFEQWSNHLNGSGSIKTTQVEIPKLDLFNKIFNSKAWGEITSKAGLTDNSQLTKLKEVDRSIRDLAGQFKVVNGVLELPNLALGFPNSSLTLDGGIGLDNTLRFTGNLNLQESLVDSFIKNDRLKAALLNSNKQLVIPLSISGTTTAPAVAPDMSVVSKNLSHYFANEAKSKIQESAPVKQLKEEGINKREEIKNKAKEGFKKLFN